MNRFHRWYCRTGHWRRTVHARLLPWALAGAALVAFAPAADVIAGDWHLIRRFMPHNLRGKTIITQSSRESEIQLLRERGARRLITTTPQIGGDAFATNVMEAVLVVLLGRHPADLSPNDYMRKLAELNWSPNVQDLNP